MKKKRRKRHSTRPHLLKLSPSPNSTTLGNLPLTHGPLGDILVQTIELRMLMISQKKEWQNQRKSVFEVTMELLGQLHETCPTSDINTSPLLFKPVRAHHSHIGLIDIRSKYTYELFL
jgi:hypothetical protein